MMKQSTIEVPLKDLNTVICAHVVPLVRPGSVLLLRGQLGAGKTTLVKALMRIIGITDEISSPTFSYVNSYKNTQTNLTVHHFDIYRLGSIEEFVMQGFDELLAQKNAMAIIEWPEILIPFLKHQNKPSDSIFCLDLTHNFTQPDTRYLTITPINSFSK